MQFRVDAITQVAVNYNAQYFVSLKQKQVILTFHLIGNKIKNPNTAHINNPGLNQKIWTCIVGIRRSCSRARTLLLNILQSQSVKLGRRILEYFINSTFFSCILL